jgi:hypothetical protein
MFMLVRPLKPIRTVEMGKRRRDRQRTEVEGKISVKAADKGLQVESNWYSGYNTTICAETIIKILKYGHNGDRPSLHPEFSH